jgi:hypothetical protein
MLDYKKVVIWGYPLHSHTHSYIHAGFYKAFEAMGYDAYWFHDGAAPGGFDFDGALFLTIGGQDQAIPLLPGCTYVLHNAKAEKYLAADAKVMQLQVYTRGAYGHRPVEKINQYTVLQKGAVVDCLCQPWATDLLPSEVDPGSARNELANRECVFVGTYGNTETEHGNGNQIKRYFELCEKAGIRARAINPWSSPVSFEENRRLVANAYLAPCINSAWQNENHYLPCRVFKNISYGHFGITNNPACQVVFGGALVHSEGVDELFALSMEKKNSPSHLEELRYLMAEVRDKHTYVNRIKQILECLPR